MTSTSAVRLIFPSSGVMQSAYARGNDICEGGMAVFAAVEVEPGAHVEVEFNLPHSRITFAAFRQWSGTARGIAMAWSS